MKPVLLLIPGLLNTAAIWGRVTPHLENLADIRIANVQTQSSIAEMARDAWKRVADVPANTPLVVCGFSMGGYIAIQMLAQPQRAVAALGLLDTSARPESPEGLVKREKTISATEKDFPKVVEGILQFGTAEANQTDAGLMDAMRQIMMEVGAETSIRQNRAIMARADHGETLKQRTLPTLVMCGRDDKITPPDASEHIAGLIPGARLEWIDNAGHMTPMEQPERVAALLKTLL
ncbi:MAG: alpha/beta hydrolase [Bdellovibrionales bacterium]|nr:alpha/beta hydrolase [Ramlibacter sp.]